MAAEVFISYSSQDFEEVHGIVERLRGVGVSVWMDEGGIEAATLWSEAIVEAINDCKVLIMMVSGHSTDSPNVVKEVMLASESGKVILPVYLEESEIPSRLKYQLTGIQHLEAFALSESGLIEELRRGLAINGVTVPGIETTSTAIPAKPPSHRRKRTQKSGWMLPGMVLLLLGFLLGWFSSSRNSDAQPSNPTKPILNTVIKLPVDAPLADSSVMQLGGGKPNIAISSDGALIVYAAKIGLSSALYKRLLNQEEAELIEGTEGAFAPFISPDGRWIGFFADNKLKKVSVDGGKPLVLTDAVNGYGGTWSDAGTIIFSEQVGYKLVSIDENGANKKLITEVRSVFPNVLQDGNHVLVTSQNNPQARYAVDLVDTQTGERRQLIFNAGSPKYVSSGHIVFCRESDLYAVEFDTETLQVGQTEYQVMESVRTEKQFGSMYAVARNDGTLVYLKGHYGGVSELTWVDRDGSVEPLGFKHRNYGTFHLSPDGRKLLVEVWSPDSSIWLLDLETKLEVEIESSGSGEFKGYPRWNPDGQAFTFGSKNGNVKELNLRRLEDSVSNVFIPGEDDFEMGDGDWTDDGEIFVYHRGSKDMQGNVWIYHKKTDKHLPFHATKQTEWGARISPDDKWVAFTKEKPGGEYEVYAMPIAGGPVQQVSIDGGEEPVWAPDGTELFYRKHMQWIGRSVKASNVLAWGDPQVMFEGNYLNMPGHSYDVSADGKRFLVIKEVHRQGESLELKIITHWSSKFASKE